MEGRRKFILILAFIMVIQSVALFYCAEKKNYIFEDDLYSLQDAHFWIDEDIRFYEKYIVNWPSFGYDRWISMKDMKESLIVHESESVFKTSPVFQIKRFISGRNYFGILNAWLSLASMNRLDLETPVYLNILIHALSVVFIYLILRKMKVSEGLSLAGCVLYGFSVTAFSMALYIRFYCISILYCLVAFYLNLLILDSESSVKNAFFEVFSLFFIYLAMKNSELIYALGPLMIVAFAASLLIMKEKKKFFNYVLAAGGIGAAGLITQTRLLRIIADPSILSAENSKLGTAISYIKGNASVYSQNLRTVLSRLTAGLFGHWLVMRAFALMAALFIMLMIIRIRKKEISFSDCAVPAATGVMVSLFLLFAALLGLVEERYLSFAFPFITVFIFSLAQVSAGGSAGKKPREKYIFVCLAVLVAAGSFYSVRHTVTSVHDGMSAEFSEKTGRYEALPSIVYLGKNPSNTVIYDCMYHQKSGAEVYYSDAAHPAYKNVGKRKRILFWADNSWTEEKMKKILRPLEKRYRCVFLARNFNSQVYLLELR